MTVRVSPLQQLRLREHQLFLALSILVGILAGLAAVLFSLSIDWLGRWLFGVSPPWWRLLAMPGAVSLVTGTLLVWVFPGVRGSGVPQTKAAFLLHDGHIPARVPIGKFITGVLCVGSGHSMGREGPSVQIGAGLASVIGRWMQLPEGRIRELVPVGAAGALSAAFNTPVSAVIFALEEIIGDLNAALLGSTVIASVAAVVVERAILGNEPLFRVPTYHLVHPLELAAYAVLGGVGGLLSLAFCRLLLVSRLLFRRLPPWSVALQPAMGGLAVGGVLVFVPEVRGVGYELVNQALNGGLLLQTLLLLCVVKVAATIISYASGNAGGIFAPSLFIGAMAGGALGSVVHHLAPAVTAEPGAYALVGMGALFAGIIRAPMTSVFMIFEITQDYQILVPLMVANLLSFVIARRFQPVPVYHALLEQDGVHLPKAQTASGTLRARDLMQPVGPLVSPAMTVAEGVAHLRATEAPVLMVGAEPAFSGVVTAGALTRAAAEGNEDVTLGTLITDECPHVHPDHPVETVLDRLAEHQAPIPVVSRDNVHHVLGVITLDSLSRRRDSKPT